MYVLSWDTSASRALSTVANQERGGFLSDFQVFKNGQKSKVLWNFSLFITLFIFIISIYSYYFIIYLFIIYPYLSLFITVLLATIPKIEKEKKKGTTTQAK